jgi:ATP-binding cassette subfamily B protein
VTIDIMRDFYQHEHKMEIAFHRTRAIGEHMYRTAEDMTDGDIGYQRGGLIGMITHDWMEIFNILYTVVWGGGAIVWIGEPVLGILVALYVVPKMAMIYRLAGWYKRIDFQNREIQQERFAAERDLVAGLRTLKSLGKTRFASNRFVQIMSYVQKIYVKFVMSRYVGQEIVVNWLFKRFLFNRGIYVYCMVQVIRGEMTLGMYTVVAMLVSQMIKPFDMLIQLVQRFRMRMVPAQRMFETMSLVPAIQDAPGAPRLARVTGGIEFERVSFGYEPGQRIISDISFSVAPGERVAFVGPSGTGKSTIFKLLLRLYDPQEGRVLVDGHDIKRIRLKSYLDHVGVILQQTHLFSGSIEENIKYGKPLARPEEIQEAIDKAELRDYVDNAPNGLETWVGEGTRISGGQKQRIGIARAIIRDPNIYIMDEPTAALDIIAETNVIKTIEKVTRGKTTLIISHRLRPVLFCDKLIVISPAGAITVGTHQQLLETSPTYQILWQEQNSGGNVL